MHIVAFPHFSYLTSLCSCGDDRLAQSSQGLRSIQYVCDPRRAVLLSLDYKAAGVIFGSMRYFGCRRVTLYRLDPCVKSYNSCYSQITETATFGALLTYMQITPWQPNSAYYRKLPLLLRGFNSSVAPLVFTWRNGIVTKPSHESMMISLRDRIQPPVQHNDSTQLRYYRQRYKGSVFLGDV